MTNIINIRANVNIQLHNIPTSLQQWDNWGIYRSDKKPITLASAINCTDIGFKINNLSSHGGSFEDAARILSSHDPKMRAKAGKPPIVGPSLAVQEEVGVVVIDLDDPQYKLEQRREEARRDGGVLLGLNGKPMTDAEFARAVASETETQRMILRAFRGHYIEKSMSGVGYHIFIQVRLGDEGGPIKRYRIGNYDLGLVFSTGSIYMTGNLIEGSSREILDGQRVLDEVIKYFTREDNAIFKEQRLRKSIGSDGSIKSIGSVDVGLVDRVDFGRRLDMSDEEVIERLRERFPKTYLNLVATGGWTNHSACKAHLIGDLDKITGSAAQIDRIMLGSNFMMYAGLDKDGHSRFKKYVDGFAKELRKARESNDETLAKWEQQAAWKAAEIERGRAFFEVICGPNDPGSLAFRRRVQREKETAANAERGVAEQIRSRAHEGWARSDRYTLLAIKAIRCLCQGLNVEEEGYLAEDRLPPGLMGEFCECIADGMYEPFIKFAIPVGLTTVAGHIARRYKTSSGQGLHLWIILIAKSASGKTQAIKAVRRFLQYVRSETYFKNRVVDMAISSKQGFHPRLMETPSFTWAKDECATQLKQILRPSNNDSTAGAMQGLVNEIFDLGGYNSEPYFPSQSVAGHDRKDEVIPNLCVSAFWGTTPSKIQDFWTHDAVENGVTSRMLVTSHNGAGGMFDPDHVELEELPQGRLRDHLKTLFVMADDLDAKYKYKAPTDSVGAVRVAGVDHRVDLVKVPLDAEASAFWRQLQINVSALKMPINGEVSEFPSYYIAFARAGMLAHRIASIMAVLESGGMVSGSSVAPSGVGGAVRAGAVSLDQFKWATGYVLQAFGGVVSGFDTGKSGAILADAPKVVIGTVKKLVATGHMPLEYGELRKALMAAPLFRNAIDPVRAADSAMREVADAGLFEYRKYDAHGRILSGQFEKYVHLEPSSVWDD